MIPYGRQLVSDEDIAAVDEVLRSDWLTQGPCVPRFEQALADRCGARHGVAVNSATSAIHIAYLALGLGPGDSLWTSPNTFVATANCALQCGARVDFVDIDPRTYNLSVDDLEAKLRLAETEGCLPKVVAPVHFAGQSCDMNSIGALAERYGFRVVEDAAHAVGGSYRGQPIGNCRYSDITVFSFHPVKIITTGEGGMALTDDRRLSERMRLLRTHGITRDRALMDGEPEGDWAYQQIDLGYNYRMTDIQAALGLSQLGRLEAFVRRRHELAARYDCLLRDLDLVRPWQHPDAESAWHLYVVRLSGPDGGRRRARVFRALRDEGIGVNVHYIPVHTQPHYRRLGFQSGNYPNAEDYYSGSITLPLHPGLTEAEQDRVVEALARALV